MEHPELDPAEDMRVCNKCGAWVRRNREQCPWCGAATESEESPADADKVTAVSAAISPDDPQPDDTATFEFEAAAVHDWEQEPDPSPDIHEPARQTLRGRKFWMRSFGLVTALVLLLMTGSVALGIYQGLNDRELGSKRDAIEYFEQGNQLLEDGRFDLAAAAFREAVRLEPNFAAAQQQLELAERRAAPPSTETQATSVIIADPTPETDYEALFEEAMEALESEDWEIAAATFGLLSSQVPGFRTEEVEDGLFESHQAAGQSALDEGEYEEALRHFDQALAARPDNIDIQQLRRMTSAYRTAQRAKANGNWQVVADQLRTIYLIDPEFLETTELLAEAHLELGTEFEERDIWCEAAQQYRSSNTVLPNSRVAGLAQAAGNRCDIRVAAPRASPTSVAAVATATSQRDAPDATPVLTATPAQAVPTETTEVFTATLVPAPLLPTNTPVPSVAFPYQLAGSVGESFDASCGGHYIRGTVRAADGAPLAGVTILAVDDYGNSLSAVSKSDPLGQFDIPISSAVNNYRVSVVSGGTALSPVVIVRHSERFSQAPQGCHILNWQQSP